MLGSDDRALGDCPKEKKLTQGKAMSDVFAAQNLLREASPLARYGKLDNVFFEACRFVNRIVAKDFTLRRARSIWEGTARRIDAEEMKALEQALVEESRREQIELRLRLASLDEKIAAFEATAHRETLARSVAEMGR